jgi:uncharacterized damage-inducible protein DinB
MTDNPEVHILIERLVRSFAESIATLSRLEEGDLEQLSGHPCAMGGPVRKLLVHNIAHDRMHAGQIEEKRWALDRMQEGSLPRLLAELVRARAEIIAAVIDLPEEALDQTSEQSATSATIREVIEHVLYWEQHSMEQTRDKFGAAQASVVSR